jgi:hypothetical protein
MTMEKLKFGSREDWEQDQRAHCWEWAENDASDKLSDYCTEAQIADGITKLRKHWKELGCQLRATTDGQERLVIRGTRRDINRDLKAAHQNKLPCSPYFKP